MTSRFTALAGFLASASLLSGSAFAFAPEFSEDLPTVIITDKLPGAPASAPYDRNGNPDSVTAYLFRYTDAFSLSAYINLQGNDVNQLKFLFNEADVDNGDLTSTGTLSINGTVAISEEVPDASDFASAPAVVAFDGDDLLDFRNIDFSQVGGNDIAGYDAIGDFTGHNIDVSDPQRRLVNLFIQGDQDPGIDVATFMVVTTRQGNDEVTDPVVTDPGQVIFSQDDLVGWNAGTQLGNTFITFGAGSTNANHVTPLYPTGTAGTTSAAGFTFTPNVVAPAVTPAGTATLGITANNTQKGIAYWGIGVEQAPSLNLTANTLYRLRVDLYSPNAASQDWVRARIGNASVGGEGSTSFQQDNGYGPHTSPTADPGTYVEIPTTQAGDDLVAFVQPEANNAGAIFIDVIPIGDTGAGAGQDIIINAVEVKSYNPTVDLTGGATLINMGGTVPTQVAGEITPVLGSPVGFVAPNAGNGTQVGVELTYANLVPAQPVATTYAAGQVTQSFNTPAANASGYTGSFAYLNGTAPATFTRLSLESGDPARRDSTAGAGHFDAFPGNLYVMDAWISTSGTSAQKQFPQLRLTMQMGSYITYHFFDLDDEIPSIIPNPAPISTQARAFTAVMKPHANVTNNEAFLYVDLISVAKQYPTASVIQLHRIQVREFVDPAGNN